MARPGFVLDVSPTTPPIMLWRGERLVAQQLPEDSRVIYPPEPLAALRDANAAVDEALDHPLAADALRSQLNANMKLTIAFDDNLSMPHDAIIPDNRQRVMEAILEMAAAAGIDDVHLIVARGINRRLTDNELRQVVGNRIFESFVRLGALYHHDAEDTTHLTVVGKTQQGNAIELSSRAAESDLLIFVTANSNVFDGGWRSIIAGLGSVSTNKILRGPIDDVDATNALAPIIRNKLNVFQIETTLDNHTSPRYTGFIERRESQWSVLDRGAFYGACAITSVLPARVARSLYRAVRSNQPMTGVFAGDVDAVHVAAAARIKELQTTTVSGQSDVGSFGVPYTGPYAANSVINPILAVYAALGYCERLSTGIPLVRDGGVIIIHHPLKHVFNPVHHPSYIDFFDNVLNETTDIKDIESNYEDNFAGDTWYSHLYRNSTAYHATHPFGVWRACAKATERLGGVIAVGAEPKVAEQLGLRSAATFEDACEMARDITNKPNPSLSHFHAPPAFTVDVK